MDTKAYKKCEYIIRQFMATDNPLPELTAAFHRWLVNGRHCREKSAVIEKLFCEALPDLDILSEHEHRNENMTTIQMEKLPSVHPT